MAPESPTIGAPVSLWRNRLLRLTAAAVLVTALLAGAFLATVGGLNRGPYSAAGFVEQYLRGLAAGDVAGALRMPGLAGTLPTAASGDAIVAPSRALLRADADGAPLRWRILRTDRGAHGVTRVEVRIRGADGARRTMRFDVEPTDAALGMFARWRFATPPWSLLRIRVAGDPVVRVGAERVDVRLGRGGHAVTFETSGSFVTLTGTNPRVSLRTPLLRARPVDAGLVPSGSRTTVSVTPTPTAAFERRVATQLRGFLHRCAATTVLYPPGCPFGLALGNRLVGAPHWSIERMPTVHLTAGADAWVSTGTTGAARVTGRVRSLFDGSVSRLDRRIVFPVSLGVTIDGDGTLDITVG